MRNANAVMLAVALALAGAAAQAPAPGTVIQAQLKSRLDSGHAKVGERIKAQVTRAVKVDGVVVLPKGAQLLGRVTAVVKAESSKSPSSISVLFTQAAYKKQPPIAFHAGIARVLAPPDQRLMDMGPPSMDMGMPAMQPPAAGGDQSGTNVRVNRPGSLGAESVPSQATANVPSAMQPPPGAPVRITLPANAAQGSMLSTPRGDVKLDAGTRLQLRVLH